MDGKQFRLTEEIMPVIEEIGRHMSRGFFIYKAVEPWGLVYANSAAIEVFDCRDRDEFKKVTECDFRSIIHPDDYDAVYDSIAEQISKSDDNQYIVEYRIINREGEVRWIDECGHYTETEKFGSIYYAFVSDITEQHMLRESDAAFRQEVINALCKPYHTVWVIDDIEKESFKLYRGDTMGKTIHSAANKQAFGLTYTVAKEKYVDLVVAEQDAERTRRELDLKNIVEHLKTHSMYNVVYLREMGDGTQHFFRIEFVRLDMPNGKMGVVCGFKDVDEEVRESLALQDAIREADRAKEDRRKLIEEIRLAANLAELMGSAASILSNMPAMSFSKDAETGIYLACNQSFAEYADKSSPDEVIGLTDYDIFDKETAERFIRDDRKALNMDKPYIFFEEVTDAAGKEVRNLQTTKTKFTDTNGKLCLLGMCVDVTQMMHLKATETKQQELEQRLFLQQKLLEEELVRDQQDKMITALASDYRSVYHVNLDTNVATCYRGDPEDSDKLPDGTAFPFYERFLYYANNFVNEEYRADFIDFIDPKNIRRRLLNEPIIAFRYLVKRGGREYYEMIRMAGVRHAEDRDDHMVHAVGLGLTVIDAEMRKSMAHSNALREALESAKEANKAKTAFLSNMSHEIRTPMNAIIGLNSLALHDDTLSDQTREYLQKIGESARHLLGLINDILDMSRIESGRMVLRREDFSFRGMLEQINIIVMSQCSEKGLKYECKVVGGINDYYIGDDMKLKQILINILSNAIKFTDAPGSVTLTVERTAVYEGQSTLKFSVKDTGIGMDPEFLPKVFDTFSQEDSRRSNKYGSTGLGMAITKNIVELMNGTISVTSEKGVGTEFTVIVTLRNSNHSGISSSDFNPSEMRVLIVDDEEIAAEHARIVLDEAGVNADTCFSGKEALRMLKVSYTKHEPYNLVLLDCEMPGMDGIETAKKIRKRYEKETTVIILTSFSMDEVIEEAMQNGVDSFLAKPIFASNVIGEFERIARKNRMELYREKKRAELKGRRILLAEDVFINAEIIKELLTLRGCIIEHAENGRIAVDMFKNSEKDYYDAILMDVRMPEMDGLAATAAIRLLSHPNAETIPIIAMTANAFDEDVQRSLQVGMNAHLSKPVEPERLYVTLEELIWEAEHTEAASD